VSVFVRKYCEILTLHFHISASCQDAASVPHRTASANRGGTRPLLENYSALCRAAPHLPNLNTRAAIPLTNPMLFFCRSMKLTQPCKTVQRCLVNAQVLNPWMSSTVDRGVVLEIGLKGLRLVGDRLSGVCPVRWQRQPTRAGASGASTRDPAERTCGDVARVRLGGRMSSKCRPSKERHAGLAQLIISRHIQRNATEGPRSSNCSSSSITSNIKSGQEGPVDR
jgi:hypothetical protein